MITRSKLVEQLRDYQIRSQHKCPPLTFFSPKLHLSNWGGATCKWGGSPEPPQSKNYVVYRRVDVAVAVFCALLFVVLILSSYVALYLQHYWSSFLIISIAITLPVRLRMLRQAHARKKVRQLPLSMWISFYFCKHQTAVYVKGIPRAQKCSLIVVIQFFDLRHIGWPIFCCERWDTPIVLLLMTPSLRSFIRRSVSSLWNEQPVSRAQGFSNLL